MTTKAEIKKALADDINTALSVNQVEELVKTGTAMLHANPVEGASRNVASIAIVADFVEEFLQSVGLLQTTNVVSLSIIITTCSGQQPWIQTADSRRSISDFRQNHEL